MQMSLSSFKSRREPAQRVGAKRKRAEVRSKRPESKERRGNELESGRELRMTYEDVRAGELEPKSGIADVFKL